MKLIKNIFIILSLFVLVSCSNPYWGNYIERNEKKNLSTLKQYSSYSQEEKNFCVKTVIDPVRAEEIISFFSDKGLPSEWLDSSVDTWTRSVAVATWVAKTVKHSNPNPYPKDRNCIDLYKWNLENPKGFNCRMHSIMLNELLLAAGIESRFVTCLPEDTDDPDCHVVNIVWLPELNKWAMIDSDMAEYVTDENGVPLSLQEMRSYLINDKVFQFNALKGFAIDTEYYKAYWTKNIFAFYIHLVNGFSIDFDRDENGKPVLLPGDKYLFLYSDKIFLDNFDDNYVENDEKILTCNEEQFWKL